MKSAVVFSLLLLGAGLASAEEKAMAVADPSGQVARAQFTTAMVEREPVDAIDRMQADRSRVFFFTELIGFEGHTVTHTWQYAGETFAEVPFQVGGPRWRVYSSKQLLPGWIGTWTVIVSDASGRELGRHQLDYLPPETAPPAAPQE